MTPSEQPFERGPQSPLWRAQEPADLVLPAGSLADSLIRSAAAFPEAPAMYYYGARYDYSQLLRDVERLAGWLAAQGVKAGDRVIVDLQNSPQYVIAFYAILRANAVVVPVNPMNTTEEISFVAADSGARAAILAGTYTDYCAQTRAGWEDAKHG